jgi:transposase
VKILYADATGTCVYAKRLDRGVFRLPAARVEGARHVEVDDATLEALLDGIDVDAKPRARRPRVH